MCMHYMMDIESHTVIFLRDLLATRAADASCALVYVNQVGGNKLGECAGL